MRINKTGFDKATEDLRQAMKNCTVSDAIQAWGCVYGAEREAERAGKSEKTIALVHALTNIVSYGRERN